MFSSDAMDQFMVEKGVLINKNNGCRYRAFVLPFCEVLPVKILRMLREFVKTGGNLFFLGMPPEIWQRRKGRQRSAADSERIAKIFQSDAF